MPITLTPEQVAHDLAIRDLTDPSEGDHALQLLIDNATTALSSTWGCAVRTARGPRIVSLADNYDRLQFPPAAVTRDARYTRYVDDDHMLRSHSSAMIPPALRTLADDPVRRRRCSSVPASRTGVTPSIDSIRVRRISSICGASQRNNWATHDMDLMIEILTTTLPGPSLSMRSSRASLHPQWSPG